MVNTTKKDHGKTLNDEPVLKRKKVIVRPE